MEQSQEKPLHKKWWAWVGGIIALIVVANSVTNSQGKAQQNITPPVQQVVAEQQISQKVISYEIVKRWTIPNGGEGKVILISPDNLNESDMVALGEKLKEDTKNDRNAFIFVFDDKTSANLRDKLLADEATTAETDLYDKHFVGDYTKNGNTGYHQFSIYFDGVMGTNQKIVKY